MLQKEFGLKTPLYHFQTSEANNCLDLHPKHSNSEYARRLQVYACIKELTHHPTHNFFTGKS